MFALNVDQFNSEDFFLNKFSGPNIKDTEEKFQIIPNLQAEFIAAGGSSCSAVCAKSGAIFAWGCGGEKLFGKVRHNIYAPRPFKLPHKAVRFGSLKKYFSNFP